MATFDQLPAEQRAIVELVLQRGKTYDELADMLGMPEARVRELARDALVELAPLSVRGVEEDWRSQLADYVLGQQAGAEATATRGHLRRSEAARTWTRSLLDSLEQFYENGALPAIPEGERGARKAAARSTSAPAAPATAEQRRRRLMALGGGLVALLLVAVLLWPVGVLTGGEDESGSGDQAAADTGAQGGAGAGAGQQAQSGKPAGIAIVAQQGGRKSVLVRASNLAPSGDREAYEVWLYNAQGDAKSLGGQVTDAQGQYQAIGALPADFADYRFIDVSREPLDEQTSHSGDSVLRGRIPKLREANPRGNQAAVLGQTVLAPPAG
ncbi:MAG TPA: anti-sigma factor [Thermoleophilaceae bacterium]|nr:anti-sigma factor [Thermoleophilaceae bacterium]